MAETIRKSTFEKDFIERTYSSVVSDVTIAFSELVANSWDAGATTVNITLPSKANEKIIIEDNGSGMTDDEFQERWMVIAYNRVAHQHTITILFLAADVDIYQKQSFMKRQSMTKLLSLRQTL